MNPKAMQPAPVTEPLTWPLSPAWAGYFEAVYSAAFPKGGTTAQRPTAPVLYQQYFDTTLGLPIWCDQVTPSVTWVDATGATV